MRKDDKRGQWLWGKGGWGYEGLRVFRHLTFCDASKG